MVRYSLGNPPEPNFKNTKCDTGKVIIDLQSVRGVCTFPMLWLNPPCGALLGFCLRLVNDKSENIGTAEFKLTNKGRILFGESVRGYSLSRLGPADMESSLPTISLAILAAPIKELT